MAIEPGQKVFHFDFMFYGWLLDNNGHRCESLADLRYPAVLLQRRKSGSDCFIERLRADLYGVLNVSDIFYRNCARSEDHKQKRSIFAFCSLQRIAARVGSFSFPEVDAVCGVTLPRGVEYRSGSRQNTAVGWSRFALAG